MTPPLGTKGVIAAQSTGPMIIPPPVPEGKQAMKLHLSWELEYLVSSGDLDPAVLRDGRLLLHFNGRAFTLRHIRRVEDIGPAIERQMRARRLGSLTWWRRIVPWLRES